MNKEQIIQQGKVLRPFEARIVSDELRDRVIYFQNLLNQKRFYSKIRKITEK